MCRVAQGSGHDAHEAKVSLGALLAALPSYVPPLLKGGGCLQSWQHSSPHLPGWRSKAAEAGDKRLKAACPNDVHV